MFNKDQSDHMRWLAEQSDDAIHWCGWFWIGEVGHDTFHPDCPPDLTRGDRRNMSCEVCGNAPNLNTGRLTHIAGCTPAFRREYYESLELGEAGA